MMLYHPSRDLEVPVVPKDGERLLDASFRAVIEAPLHSLTTAQWLASSTEWTKLKAELLDHAATYGATIYTDHLGDPIRMLRGIPVIVGEVRT